MIKVLHEFKINPKIVEIVSEIYKNDNTALYLNNEEIINIEITSGIRQGCNLSALLFILVTYKIIEVIHKITDGYNDEDFNIKCLFYMDDGLIMTQNPDKFSEIICRLQTISMRYGLVLNKEKCKIISYNSKNMNDKICEIDVVDKFKYLGILINNKRKCFTSQK